MVSLKTIWKNPGARGFLLVAVFITLLIIPIVNDRITADITESRTAEITVEFAQAFIEGCALPKDQGGLDLADRPDELAICIERAGLGAGLTNFQKADCSLCGAREGYPDEQGLCLKDEDLIFCNDLADKLEVIISAASGDAIAQFGAKLEQLTEPVQGLSDTQKLLGVVVLFSIGFISAGGLKKL